MIDLELQNPSGFKTIPKQADCQHWVDVAIQETSSSLPKSIVIRFVDEVEGLELNHSYRNKKSTTNVLSFPFETPSFLTDEPLHLGDLVLCEPVVLKEASDQNKTLLDHWAHLIIHGTLHLQGYDHLNDEDANVMESLEIKILENLGFNNPYESSSK